ncbi:hypothetical protein [Paraburkholderia sp. DGU8]|uniref:hypothetical protein n=1 Tax=Paraburkholderia sp. DGU8 TaxID=3161997 RepID=UPI003466ABDF
MDEASTRDIERLKALEQAAQKIDEAITQGSKGLAVLSSGAALAMLAFMQALALKACFAQFKWYGVTSFVILVMGALIPSLIFFQRIEFHRRLAEFELSSSGPGTPLKRIRRALTFSAVLFVLGVAVAVVGMCRAL